MDRIALAKRLESLSSVFASHTPYNRDLRAMSYVLSKLDDTKFKTILSGDFSADEVDACMCGKGPGGPLPGIVPMGAPVDEPADGKPVLVIQTEGGMPMSAEATEKTAGMFWSKDASKAVIDNLLRDVVGMNKSVCCDTGRHLDKEQIPDGTGDGEKAPTLKPEQIPSAAESIKTNMVEKSHGAVQKEASLEDIQKKKKEDKEKKMKKDVDKLKKDKAEKKASEEGEDEKDAAAESSSSFEGIELVASMDEVELDAKEAAELSKLFE